MITCIHTMVIHSKLFTDKPDELLSTDSKHLAGHNPVIGEESKANK